MKKIILLIFSIFFLTNCSLISKDKIELLFVQNGKKARFDGKKITIRKLSPHTIYFSNKPYRIASYDTNQNYIKKYWLDKRKDNFSSENPNAAISFYFKNKIQTSIIEISNPKLINDSISYNVKILNGKIPQNCDLNEVALFIDNAGQQGVDEIQATFE